MKTIYTENYDQFKMIVEETDDQKYTLSIQFTQSTPLINAGEKLPLDEFINKQDAFKASQQFPKMYRVAEEEGFYFNGTEFKHPKVQGNFVHISIALDLDRSAENFRSYLRSTINVQP